MIFFLGFPLLSLVSCKFYMFFNSIFFINSLYLMLAMISFCVFFMISSFFFIGFNKFYLTYYYFFTFMLLFMNFCFFSESFFTFLIFFELSLFPMIYMIFNYSSDFEKISSSFFMVLMNLLGSIPYILISSFFYYFGISMDFSMLIIFGFSLNSIIMHFSIFSLYLFKLPFFFFHFWLPKAHVSASGSTSIVLASIMLKLGSIGILKMCFLFLSNFLSIYIIYGVFVYLMFFMISFYMIRFFDVKYMVAMSSVSHMSSIPLLIMSLNSFSIVSSLMMMIGHGLISSMLFYFVTLYYEQSFNRSLNFIKGFDKVSKFFISLFLFWILLNFGLPPFLSFLSEFYLMFYIFYSSHYMIFFFFFFFIFCNLVFMFFLVKGTMFKSFYMVMFDLSFFFIFLNFTFMLILLYMSYLF